MVKYTDQELEQLAQPTFEQFPDVNEVYATTDGNIFVSENLANLHATSKGKVLAITRKSHEVVNIPPKQTAAEIIAILENATTLEEIIPYQFDKRATVKAAVKKAFETLAELQKQETVTKTFVPEDLGQPDGTDKTQD